MTTFGSILKEKRRAAGLSQRQLADKVGVDFSYISKLENDRLQPPASETIARIAECVRCPVEELLAAAKKMPAGLNDSVVNEPAAVRFLQEASRMELTTEEWNRLLGQLHGLREENE
jgi:transcriptional regulator with XRE-family HTH domain